MQLQAVQQHTPPLLRMALDGTVVRTSLLLEAVLAMLRTAPGLVFWWPVWLLGGWQGFRAEINRRITIDPASLPYALPAVEDLRAAARAGRRIELVAPGDHRLARAVANHLGIADAVIIDTADASPPRTARSHGVHMLRRVRAVPWAALLRALRPYQWAKNTLVFIPMMLAHRIAEPVSWLAVAATFLAFCMCASAIYLCNDLLDAPDDARHPTKRLRPIAAGVIDRRIALAAVPVLVGTALGLAALISSRLLLVLVIYLAITTVYSLILKRKMLWDVFTLASLYTLRIIAGAVAIDKHLSFWLLAFSVFTFLSLALVKRYVELRAFARVAHAEGRQLSGRGYRLCDIETLHQVGIASCFSAVLVFALYINSEQVRTMYATPEALWLACPALLYLQLRFWMLARREEMHDDPVVFALRDLRSQLVLAAVGIAMVGAMM